MIDINFCKIPEAYCAEVLKSENKISPSSRIVDTVREEDASVFEICIPLENAHVISLTKTCRGNTVVLKGDSGEGCSLYIEVVFSANFDYVTISEIFKDIAQPSPEGETCMHDKKVSAYPAQHIPKSARK